MSRVEQLRNKTINDIIAREAGYVNDHDDSGGETNFGITITVARQYGYEGAMADMPRSFAFDVYVVQYWNKLHLSDMAELDADIADKVADIAVNLGRRRAATFLQRCLNLQNNCGKLYRDIKVDGDIGGVTVSTLASFLTVRGKDGAHELHKMLNCLQGEFYISLSERREKDEKFIFGWFKNRINFK